MVTVGSPTHYGTPLYLPLNTHSQNHITTSTALALEHGSPRLHASFPQKGIPSSVTHFMTILVNDIAPLNVYAEWYESSVCLGPKHDFLKELMDTAKKENLDMKRGTYYSLPKWFNPSYAQYGFLQWPGGLARNAFNSSIFEPYIGYLPIEDYVNDLRYEYMKRIVEVYDSDIMVDLMCFF
ncbi:hypothetical protein BDQ17DRAFT_1434765 [Cyathus striatus]|nr:hypothetical protein BDQ17DRAFT_1434765 [Cyathus striatus]